MQADSAPTLTGKISLFTICVKLQSPMVLQTTIILSVLKKVSEFYDEHKNKVVPIPNV